MHLRGKYEFLKGRVQAKFKQSSSTSSKSGSGMLPGTSAPSYPHREATPEADRVAGPASRSGSGTADNPAPALTNDKTTVASLLDPDITPSELTNTAGLIPESHASPLVAQSYTNLLAFTSDPKGADAPSKGNWTNLKRFVHLIGSLSVGFGPLKSTVDEVLRFVEMTEDTMTGNTEYQNIKAQLESTFEDLQGHFSGDEPPAMTGSMQNLCRAIESELGNVSRTQAMSRVSQYLEAKRHQDEIVECYRRIHEHYERFRLNTSIAIWKVVERQAAMTTSIQTAVNKQNLETLLNKLTPSTSAYYNSAEAVVLNRRDCTPNTRSQALQDLDIWIKSGGSKIFWLNGMAGTGKTTIANTLCATLDQSLSLAASFFCSHQLPECRNIKLIIPTLAHQLARYSSPYSVFLAGALQFDPEVHTRALRIQFEHMILGPLRGAALAIPEAVAVVIDALDECEDKNGVGQLLELLIEYAPELPIKFFVSSRPEPEVRRRMGRIESRMILHELDHQVVREDIKTYLEVELRPISPSNSELASLTERAGVLFIYAATVVRYVGAKDFSLNPRKRLAAVLDSSSLGASNRTRDIDALYGMVLASALDDPDLELWDKELVKLVLDTVVCAQEPLTTSAISGLLKLDGTERVHEAIRSLWSVLHISSDDIVTTLHASFPDYMLDISRSQAYGCHAALHHNFLGLRCFNRIKDNPSQFNVCQLGSSSIADEAVPNLATRVTEAIAPDLWYACQYWATHLTLAELSYEISQALYTFLSMHLLLWMEVMNLRKQIGLGARLMEQVIKLCTDKDFSSNTRELVRDAWRFISTFTGNPVSTSTPHIYVSMLAFWPQHSPLSDSYLPRTRGLIQIKGSRMERRQPLLSVFPMGHGATCAALSPDGAYLISGDWDTSLTLRDARTGYSIGKPFQGHADWVNSVAFSPDGAYIASGSSDTTVRLWDARTGEVTSNPLRGHTDSVRSVTFSPDGTRLASGSVDTTIRIWDVNTKRLVCSPLMGHSGSINSVVFSPDGRRIASASDDKTIVIWDTRTRLMIGDPLRGHTYQVTSVSFSPNNTHIVSGSRDTTLRIWDSGDQRMVGGPLKGHTAPVNSVVFSPDGTLVLSSSDDNTLQLWDPHTGRAIGGPLKCHNRRVYSGFFSSNGARIISVSADKTIRVWDAQTKRPTTNPLDGHSDWVQAVAFSPEGTRIVSGSKDKTIKIWNATTGQMVGPPFCGHTGTVNSVMFFANGTRIVSGSEDGTVRIWDADTGELVGRPLEGHYASVNSVSVSPDGTRVASGSDDRTVRIWDAETGQSVGSPLNGHSDSVRSVVFSPDGLLIASGSRDRFIRFWDAQTGQALGTPLNNYPSSVNSIAFSPDGAYILSASSNPTIRMWDTNTKQVAHRLITPSHFPVAPVTFSPDNAFFVSGSDDGTILVWNARTGQVTDHLLRGHTSLVTSVMFSPDGAILVSASEDATLRIWNAPTNSSNNNTAIIAAESDRSFLPNPASPITSTRASPREDSVASWVLGDDQWVRDRQSGLLVWIPHDLRDTLIHPHTLLVISSEGSTELDFSHAKIGNSWAECYSPH